MKFYKVKFNVVNANDILKHTVAYLFSPLNSKKEISKYMFNVWAKRYPKGFILFDIEEISLETFIKENKENLHTMILSTIEEN